MKVIANPPSPENPLTPVEIVSTEGNIVFSKKLQIAPGISKQTINTASLGSGKYFMRCMSADGQMNLKFVK